MLCAGRGPGSASPTVGSADKHAIDGFKGSPSDNTNLRSKLRLLKSKFRSWIGVALVRLRRWDAARRKTVLMIVVLALLSIVGFLLEGGAHMIGELVIHLIALFVVEQFARRAESMAF